MTPPSDPLADMIPDDPPAADPPARPYRPAKPSATRRAVLFAAWTAGLLIVIGAPLLYYVADIDVFGNPDHWREQPFKNRSGQPSRVFYTGRVSRADARLAAEYCAGAEEFGGAEGPTVILDWEGDGFLVTVFTRNDVDDAKQRTPFEKLRTRLSRDVFGGRPVVLEVCEPVLKIRPGRVVKRVRARIDG